MYNPFCEGESRLRQHIILRMMATYTCGINNYLLNSKKEDEYDLPIVRTGKDRKGFFWKGFLLQVCLQAETKRDCDR